MLTERSCTKSSHWVAHISQGRALILLEPQSRFGENPLEFQVICPQNGTAVLKGLTTTWCNRTTKPYLNDDGRGREVSQPVPGHGVRLRKPIHLSMGGMFGKRITNKYGRG